MQVEAWTGDFGREYTDRNALTTDGLDALYKARFGVTRTEMNTEFLGDLSRDIKILEVGSNIGNQLALLQGMGFKNLYGIDVQPYAVELSKKRTSNINIIYGSAFDIPFKDEYFDLVFTSGLLIHIHPLEIQKAITEIIRCAKTYIWGFEYYSEKYQGVRYRGDDNLLWKANFADMFRAYRGITTIKEKIYSYIGNDNQDMMYLLKNEPYIF